MLLYKWRLKMNRLRMFLMALVIQFLDAARK